MPPRDRLERVPSPLAPTAPAIPPDVIRSLRELSFTTAWPFGHLFSLTADVVRYCHVHQCGLSAPDLLGLLTLACREGSAGGAGWPGVRHMAERLAALHCM